MPAAPAACPASASAAPASNKLLAVDEAIPPLSGAIIHEEGFVAEAARQDRERVQRMADLDSMWKLKIDVRPPPKEMHLL
jgi:hypothetical protein